MGPGGCSEPGREGPRFVIVSSADIDAEPSHTLLAEYWTTREPEESYATWRLRRACEDAERRAAWHEGQALHLRAEAGQQRLASGLPPGPQPAVYLLPLTDAEHGEMVVLPAGEQAIYDRGQAAMLERLAAMTPAERAEMLSRARHPSKRGGGQ